MSDASPATGQNVHVLESMTIGMILDKAIHVYGRDFLLLVAVTAIPSLISSAVGVRFSAIVTTLTPRSAILLFTALAVSMVLSGVGGGAMTVVVSNRYLGKDITFTDAYRAAFRKIWKITGAMLLGGLFIILGLIGLAVPGIILALSFSLVSPVIMVEGLGGRKSLKRSRLLIKGYRWQALLVFGLCYAVLMVAILIISAIFGVIVFLTHAKVTPLAGQILNYVLVVLLGPFTSVLSVLIYYNQRIRKESFDLAFLAEAMAQHAS
jgi:hypothetical protein